MISLGGGMPNPETFPIQSGTLTLKDGTKIDITPERMKVALQYSETVNFYNWLEITFFFFKKKQKKKKKN